MLMKPARRAAWEGPGYPRGRGPEAATDPGSTPLLLMGWGGAGMLVAGSHFFLLDAERIVLMPTRPRTSLTDQGEPTPTSAPRQLPSCVPWFPGSKGSKPGLVHSAAALGLPASRLLGPRRLVVGCLWNSQ